MDAYSTLDAGRCRTEQQQDYDYVGLGIIIWLTPIACCSYAAVGAIRARAVTCINTELLVGLSHIMLQFMVYLCDLCRI